MTEQAVAPYDPEKLMDTVKARIRSEFVSIIPDDAWKAMVKKTVDKFFERERGYGDERPSEFDRLVSNLIHEEIRKRMMEYFQGPEWQGRMDSVTGKARMSEAIEKILKENASEIVARVLGNAMQSALQDMMNKMRQM